MASNINTLIPCIKSEAHGLPLKAVRQIESRSTGRTNFVLVFDGAEVVMPGNWNIRESEFPQGLYEGIELNAYWDADNRFHLEQA